MMELTGKTVVVVGLGKSGAAAALFLKHRGANVSLTDSAEEAALDNRLLSAVKSAGVGLDLGGHDESLLLSADLIVISPGVPLTIAPLKKAFEKNIPVISEIELASAFLTQPIVAVTGTNGKTTTTTLIGEMLTASGRTVFVGGNIGNPLIGFVDQNGAADVVVVEVSSFQLDTIVSFHPTVAVILNITEDHLSRYEGFNGYVRSKGRIVENQQPTDTVVLNAADAYTLEAAQATGSRKTFFGSVGDVRRLASGEVQEHAVIDDTFVEINGNRITVPAGTLRTRHNMENVAAAALAVLAAGGNVAGIQAAVDAFSGLPHRLEYVDRIKEVDYFDDSKATNTDAVKRALESFDQPIVLLLGGQDKGCDFGVMKDAIRKHARAVVLLGEARDRLRQALNGSVPVQDADSMDAAVRCAAALAEPGDVVLLSPACASFDMYNSYAHRGEDFCRVVQVIKGERA